MAVMMTVVMMGAWWCWSLIGTLRKQRQGNLCEFKASLVYIINSKRARTASEILFQKQTNQQTKLLISYSHHAV